MNASVVVSYKEPDDRLINCLAHILDNRPFELLAFSGGTEARDAQRGLEAASGDIVFFTNADTYVPTDWIARHSEYYPEYDCVLGATAYSLRSLAFRNFSAKRDVLLRYSFREIGKDRGLCWDTELGIRMEQGGVKAKIDNSIIVVHDHPGGDNINKRFSRKFNSAMILVRTRTPPTLEDIKHSLDWLRHGR